MYYRRYSSNKASGEHAHLFKKTLRWEESWDSVNWMPMEGIIKNVSRDGKRYCVEAYVEATSTHQIYWITPHPQRIRNIQMQSEHSEGFSAVS